MVNEVRLGRDVQLRILGMQPDATPFMLDRKAGAWDRPLRKRVSRQTYAPSVIACRLHPVQRIQETGSLLALV